MQSLEVYKKPPKITAYLDPNLIVVKDKPNKAISYVVIDQVEVKAKRNVVTVYDDTPPVIPVTYIDAGYYNEEGDLILDGGFYNTTVWESVVDGAYV